MTADRASRVRSLNDAFRIAGPAAGGWLITSGVQALGSGFVLEAIAAVQRFDRFDRGNDPHGEHDFGSLEVKRERLIWKIDYYDIGLTYASPDPGDPDVTRRILTLMLASEY